MKIFSLSAILALLLLSGCRPAGAQPPGMSDDFQTADANLNDDEGNTNWIAGGAGQGVAGGWSVRQGVLARNAGVPALGTRKAVALSSVERGCPLCLRVLALLRHVTLFPLRTVNQSIQCFKVGRIL